MADVLYLDDDITVTNATVFRGPFFVGTQSHVGIYAEAISGLWAYRYEFYADQALTQLLDIYEFDFGTQFQTMHLAVPTIGPWLQVRVTGVGVAVESLITLWGAAGRVGSNRRSDTNILITKTAVAIGAGATVNVDATPLWPGEAHLNFQQAAGTSRLLLTEPFSSGGTEDFWRRDLAAGASVGEMVKLPPGSVRATITNTSAAASTYSLYLVGGLGIMG